MADRYGRIQIFEGTMDLCRQHEELKKCVEHSITEQKIIWETDPVFTCAPRFEKPAKLILSPQRTFEAARKYADGTKKVCALNFASSVSPGGGVVNGASAQEESMCRISTLYPALSDQATAGAFYERHWQIIRSGGLMTRKNTDDCIYAPGVKVIKEDTFDCALMPESDWYSVDVLTCAAPDLRFAYDQSMYRPDAGELSAVFEQRWRRILSVAAEQKVDVLILGALGCGAFENPPQLVAAAFANVLGEYSRCFETIEFAVFTTNPSGANYQAFGNIPGIEKI